MAVVTLYPTQDAFESSGSNWGHIHPMQLGYNSDRRRIYFDFDFSGLPGDSSQITKATLNLFVSSSVPSPYALTVIPKTVGGAWNDMSISSSNAPSIINPTGPAIQLKTQSPNSNTWISVDVTEIIKSNIANPSFGGVVLDPTSPAYNQTFVTIHDIESSNKPQLVVEYNTPPTTPAAFTSPAAGTVLKGGETSTVAWPASTDAEGNAIYYDLEVQLNNGNWTYLITQTSRTYQYTVPKGTANVAFRVRAQDQIAGSPYRTSEKFVVSNNAAPTITLATADNLTLYENDIFSINGSVTDVNIGDVVSVKYSIDGGAARAILANVSTGSAISFAKNLIYKAGMLYDGATAVTGALAEGSQHTLKVWAEDDKGGKSNEITRSFYVVPNRAATLTLDAFVTRTGLINTDVVNISGKVADLDNGNVIVKYKIGNGAFVQVFNNTVGATPTPFNFNVLLADLTEGDNQVTIQAVDAYNAITQQVLTIRKIKNEVPMLEAVTYYEITPPNGASDGLQLYVEREVGDLVVAVDVFMGAPGQSEVFVPMTLASTANLTNGNAEDTFSYEHGTDASKIVVRIKMTRSSGASNKAIKKISGVLT